jgi:hypothetical protein
MISKAERFVPATTPDNYPLRVSQINAIGVVSGGSVPVPDRRARVAPREGYPSARELRPAIRSTRWVALRQVRFLLRASLRDPVHSDAASAKDKGDGSRAAPRRPA